MLNFNLVKGALYRLFDNIIKCFWKYNLLLQILAIILTYFFIISGFDWFYFEISRNTYLKLLTYPSIIIGGIMPMLLPLTIYVFAKLKNNLKALNTTSVLAQTTIIGLIIPSFYKAISGRAHPALSNFAIAKNNSGEFNFGFLRNGIVWGWPSGHTVCAFAMALAIILIFPKNKKIKYFAVMYAIYIGLGMSITLHWFSDVIAGALIGIIISITVGKSFRDKFTKTKTE